MLNTSVLLILIIVQLPRFWVSLSMYCSNLISAKIFTVHTKVKILPHLSVTIQHVQLRDQTACGVPLVSEVCVHHRSLYSLLATDSHTNPAILE